MNQKKVKAIRRKVNADVVAVHSAHEYRAANKDLEMRIKNVGIERITSMLGYAPLTCYLKKGCRKLAYKKAKRAVA